MKYYNSYSARKRQKKYEKTSLTEKSKETYISWNKVPKYCKTIQWQYNMHTGKNNNWVAPYYGCSLSPGKAARIPVHCIGTRKLSIKSNLIITYIYDIHVLGTRWAKTSTVCQEEWRGQGHCTTTKPRPRRSCPSWKGRWSRSCGRTTTGWMTATGRESWTAAAESSRLWWWRKSLTPTLIR